MTEILAGEYVASDITAKARGGTEQMASRMVRDLPQQLLKPFHIIHSRVRQLPEGFKRILVCHDLAGDPEIEQLSDRGFRRQFSKIVFVSNWQAQQYVDRYRIRPDEYVVIRNAIEPFTFQSGIAQQKFAAESTEVINLVYHTTPHRGLEILVPVFEALQKTHDNITLDVFSSFKIYGWEERDEVFEPLFKRCKENDSIRYWGTQDNEFVRKTLIHDSHIFAYPSLWQETSCLAAIEAMAAGCRIVHPNYGALPETCWHFSDMYQFDQDVNTHANRFYDVLDSVIRDVKNQPVRNADVAKKRFSVYNCAYDWFAVKNQWVQLLEELSNGTSTQAV